MEVTSALIDKLSHLARLHFSESEKAAISKDLQQMIGFVEKLNDLDLAGVEPMLHLNGEANVMRDDEVKSPMTREQAFQNAPLHDESFFRTPKAVRNPANEQDGTTASV